MIKTLSNRGEPPCSNSTHQVLNATPGSFSIRLPIDIDLKLLHNPFKLNKKRGDDLNAWFLSTLIHKSERKRLPMDSFHDVPRRTLQGLFRGNYKDYIERMKELDYIKEYSKPYQYIQNGEVKSCKGSFSKGNCKRYALNYKEPIFRPYEITDKKLVEKIKNIRKEKTRRTIENDTTAQSIYNSIKMLAIDDKKAMAFLYKKYNKPTIDSYFKHLHSTIGEERTNTFLQAIQREKISLKNLQGTFKRYGFPIKYCREVKQIFHNYNSLQYRVHQVETIKRIQNGEHDLISIIKDYKTGRLFHTLTMTPKNLRPFLTLNNEPLVELDASNCQWWLFQKVVHILISKNFFIFSSFYQDKANNNNINNHRPQPFNLHKYIHANPTLYMCTTFLKKNKQIIRKELYKLESLLYKNEFRNAFVKEFERNGREVSDGNIKAWLLKHILFSNPNTPYHKDLTIVHEFNTLFPYLSKVMKDLKVHLLNESELHPKKDDNGKPVRWKCLAILLQKMEADIFVKGMANVIDTPYITLHDAIITTNSNFHKIEKTLSKELKRRNLKMKLKISKI